MAIKIYDRYTPRAIPADANYPQGSIKNESTPGANDGTPLEKDWGNDISGFHQKLLLEGGVTPSGNPDTVLASDYYDSLQNVLMRSGGKPFATVAALKADTTVKVGDFVTIESYTATNNSGTMYGEIVAAATGTDDGGSYIDLPSSGLQFKQNFSSFRTLKQFGCEADGITDDTVAANNAANSLDNGGVLVATPGVYMISPIFNPPNLPDTFGGIQLLSNTHFIIQEGARIKAIAVSENFSSVVNVFNKQNILISGGGIVEGEYSRHLGSAGEQGMGVIIMASNNVEVNGIEVTDCWGDGIYVGSTLISAARVRSSRIRILNCVIHDSRRQGVSVVGVSDFNISGNTIYNINVVPPSAAIDLEPDSLSDANTDGMIVGNRSYGNAQGLTFFTGNINITVSGNEFKSSDTALRLVDSIINTRITGNIFEGGSQGVEACMLADASSIIDHETNEVAENTFIGHGTNGVCNINNTNIKRLSIERNRIITDTADVVAISCTGDGRFFHNTLIARGAALSGASKALIYASEGLFGGNITENVTTETIANILIGSSKVVFQEPDLAIGTTGLFQPTLTTSGEDFTDVTYAAVTGARWTKVGPNLIHVQGSLRTTGVTVGSASGTVMIGGLPFPASANSGGTADGFAALAVATTANWSVNNPSEMVVVAGSNKAQLSFKTAPSGPSSDTAITDVDTVSPNGNIVFFSGMYTI